MLAQHPALQHLIRTARKQPQWRKHSLTWYSPMICTEISVTNFVHPIIDLDQAKKRRDILTSAGSTIETSTQCRTLYNISIARLPSTRPWSRVIVFGLTAAQLTLWIC